MEEDVIAKGEEVSGEEAEERYFRFPMDFEYMEALYRNSEGVQWKEQADRFCSEFLIGREMEEFFKVPVSDLDNFCCNDLRSLDLRNLLADVLMFFKLHSTWEIFICPIPSCLCWFTKHDSLIVHLMCKHSIAWSFLQHNPTKEEWCKKTIRSTVWKPIDVVSALRMLSTMSLDAKDADGCLNADHLGYLEWPLSQDSDPFSIAPPFSFRFIENESLSCFVELVKQICKLVQHEASRSREAEVSKDDDVLWSRENLDVVSFQDDCDSFVLDPAKINLGAGGKGGITSWLFEAPIAPSIPLVPSRASKILKLLESKAASLSERLTTFSMQSDFRSADLTSWIKLCSRGHWLSDRTCVSLVDTTVDELASNGKPCLADVDHVPSPSSNSATEPTKHRQIESDSEMIQHNLELVKLTCELQLLELQVRQHSDIDLRMFILPIMRSSLRMKLYIFLLDKGYCEIDELQLRDVDPLVAECLAERFVQAGWYYCIKYSARRTLCWVYRESSPEYPEQHAHSDFKEVQAADSSEDATSPFKRTCYICKKLSLAPLELGSSGNNANSISEVDPVMMDDTKQEAGIDGRASNITSEDTALISRSSTSMATSIAGSEAEPEAIPKSDSVPESKAEPGSQWLQEDENEYFWSIETCSDSDTAYSDTISESSESEIGCQNTGGNIIPVLDWYEREHRAWETKKNGVFFRIKITDVVKHCLESSRLFAARSIWEWKRNRNLQYWICFPCQERFADQVSHMVHMECTHQLGLPCNYYSLVPSQVWQEDLSRANGDVKERTPTLDACIEVDETYSTFLVNMAKVRTPFSDDQDELWVGKHNLFVEKVVAIRHQLSLLRHQFDSKCNLHWASQVPELDAEIAQNFAQLEKLKQELSKLCVIEYKDQILPSIRYFLQDKTLTEDFGELTSWACKRLEELLG